MADQSAPSSSVKFQSFPAHPPPPPVIAKYFKLFHYLQEELQLTILSFVADAPFESMPANYPKSALTNELPAVSRQFRLYCRSDLFWKDAVLRITKKEPGLWKEALRKMSRNGGETQQQQESLLDLVERTHQHLGANNSSSCSYKTIYEQVVNQHLRFKGPVFFMPGQVALGQTYALHLFEYRYRLLIAHVMRHLPPEAVNGGPIPTPVYFIHANRAPLEPTVPAVLVQVVHCQIFADGRADVVLLPVNYVWIERVWERPDSGGLSNAQCLKMGQRITSQMNHLQRQEALANVMDRLAGQLNEAGSSHPNSSSSGEHDDDDDVSAVEDEGNAEMEYPDEELQNEDSSSEEQDEDA